MTQRERIVTPSQVAVLTAKVESTDERLDRLHSDISELRGEIKAVDTKLDQINIEVAKLGATQGGLTLSPKAVKVIGGIIAAVILALAQAMAGGVVGEKDGGDDEKIEGTR